MKNLPLVFFLLAFSQCQSLKHNFVVNQDARTLIAPIGAPYGFLKGGCFGFDIFDFDIEVGHRHARKVHPAPTELAQKIISNLDAGFLLKRFESESAFNKYEQEFLTNSSHCVFDSFRLHEEDPIFFDDDLTYESVGDVTTENGIFLPIRWANSTWRSSTASIMYQFTEKEEGLYFLFYQVCPKDPRKWRRAEVRTTFEIDFHYKNLDNFGHDSYLTAGEMPLPLVYFYFFMSYLLCTVFWILNIQGIQQGKEGCFAKAGERPVIFPIHHLISLLLVLKTATMLLESIRYHYIRVTGHAEFWSVLYYIMSAVKSVFLFTVVLLIGSGWSFVKPFLTDREKTIIVVVLVLQVLDNIALVVLSTEAVGESVYDDWSAILHMLDILCCCAVLIPIVWQVNSLERTLETEDQFENSNIEDRADQAKTLQKLKLFRSFYLIVVAYIYFTRIAVYLFSAWLSYRHTWVRYFFTELATLAFYVAMGLQFRPMTENPYLLLIKKDGQDGVHVEMEELGIAPSNKNIGNGARSKTK